MKTLLLLLICLSPSLFVCSGEPAPVPPPAGSTPEAWHNYQNAVAAWNQREAAARLQAAQTQAQSAAQAAAQARAQAAATAEREFERKQRERLAQQEAFRRWQQQEWLLRALAR
jgi:hypothetical protein